jgi:halogenation protein CepH
MSELASESMGTARFANAADERQRGGGVREQFDVIVVGGGPAGSVAASFVAMQGNRVLLLEKETFPRYQIGESLALATVLGVCRMLGVSEELRNAGFTVKRGANFRWGANEEPWAFSFTDSLPSPTDQTFSYQVERMKFDEILLRNAARLGVEVRENCAVHDVIADADRVRGVRYVDADGQERTATATIVVDASGNTSRIYRGVAGPRQYSEFFRNIALFGYFDGGRRLPEPCEGNILTAAFDSGWFWYIPLRDNLTSVGAVVRREMAAKVQGDKDKALANLIAECPLIEEYLGDAKRVTEGVYGQTRVRKDYSYCADRFWRPGMVLVGDAACFVDPVLSTGVHLATYSALLAARSINSTLAGTVDEQEAFDEFEARYRREYGNFYEFIVSFYDMHVDESSYFWRARKVINHQGTDLAAFARLISGVSSGDGALVASAATETDDRDRAMNLRFDPFRAKWGATRWIPGGLPTPRASGLIPSEDGMSWQVRVNATV